MRMKHWQDPVNALLAAWLILSPWAVGFQAEQLATWNFVSVGALLLAAALGAIFLPHAWEEWVEVALGAWLVVSPWLLGFSGIALATQNAVFTGLVVVVMSLWVLLSDEAYAGWWQNLMNTTKLP
jgi:hypothetical protein